MNSGSCPAIELAAAPAVVRVAMKSVSQSAQMSRTHPRSHALRSCRHDTARADAADPTPGSGPRGPLRRPQISFSQGAEWKALISKYIGAIPLSGDAACAAEQSTSGAPAPRTPVSSPMIAKVGAAARPSQWTAPRPVASTFPARPPASSRRVAIIVANPRRRADIGFVAVERGNMTRQPLAYSSWRRHHGRASLRPLGARSSHWYMPQRPSNPRA
jgi:hypothetical protein